MSRSKLGGFCPLVKVPGEEAFKLWSQQIGRSPLFTGLTSLMLQLSGIGEDASELPPVETPSKRELNLLESRFFKVSLSSSSGVVSFSPPGCFFPGLRPRVFKVERFHPEPEDDGEDDCCSASKKKLSFRVRDRFRLRLFPPSSSSLMGDWSRLLTVFNELVEALLGMEGWVKLEEEENVDEVEEDGSSSRLGEDSLLLRTECFSITASSLISRPLNLTD